MLNRRTVFLFMVLAVLYVSAGVFAVPPPPVPEPDIAVTDSSGSGGDLQVDFGTVSGGGASSHTLTIGNAGNTYLYLGTIASADPLALPFTIDDSSGCASSQIDPGGTCTFTVLFTPVSNGVYNDTFDIPSDDPDEDPVIITVTGTGTDIVLPPGSSDPDITVLDTSGSNTDLQIAFGTVTGGGALSNTITIQNDGAGALTIGTIAQTNGLAGPFTIETDNCSSQLLDVGESCTVVVGFFPTSNGIFSDTFDIPSTDPDENPVTFSVSGTGTAIDLPPGSDEADITVTDDSGTTTDLAIDFGIIEVGSSLSNSVTVTNDGNALLTLEPVALANTLAAPFGILNDTCSSAGTLGESLSCGFDVEFAPLSAGPFSDVFDITSDDPDEVTILFSVSGIANTPGNTAPTAPVLVSPEDLAVDVASPVTFVWQKSTDADGDAITYGLYYSQDNTFSGTVPETVASASTNGGMMYAGLLMLPLGMAGLTLASRKRFAALAVLVLCVLLLSLAACGGGGGGGGGGGKKKPGNKVSFSPPDTLQTGAVYYWKVVADDGRGGITSSETRSFTAL
jgi:hypothetical protein